MWNGINAREFPRIKIKIDVDLIVNGNSAHVSSMTENIGIGGLCLIVNTKVDNFSLVKLKLDLDDGHDSIKCNGRVVWSVERRVFGVHKPSYDIGVEFLDVAEGDVGRIKQFVLNAE